MMKGFHTKGFCSRGFTLIELMVIVALVAILTMLAYSSYTESVRKANRGDAQSALTGLASAMQRYYTEQTPSTYVGATASPPGPPKSAVFPDKAPLDSARKHYDLVIANPSATGYTLQAVPISGGAQATDKCGTLTLTSTGQRGISGAEAGVTWQDCWR